MSFMNHASGLRRAACIGATLALVGLAAPAHSAPVETAWVCEQTNRSGEQYINVTFDPTRFGIESAEDDAGWEYEVEFLIDVTITEYDDAKPGWNGPEICSFRKAWKRNLPIMNIRYEFDEYAMPERFEIGNVPRHSVVRILFLATELDDFVSDFADFSIFPDVNNEIEITFFANAWKAQSMTGKRQNAFDINIGLAKRLAGDGHIAGWDRNRTFRAFLDFTLDANIAERQMSGPGGASTPPPPPTPDQNPVCKNYALKAVEQNQEAQRLNCGLTGPEWSNDHQMHFDWCVRGNNSQTLAPQGTKDRQAALDACKQANTPPPPPPPPTPAPSPGSDPNVVAMCQLYANEALKIAAKAAALNCGFAGGRWLQDYNAHYNFCIATPNPILLLAEAAQRDADYKACGGS